MIKFGPAGFGGKEQAILNLEKFRELGLKACEVAFTYKIYLEKQDAIKIGKRAQEIGIFLSIHAPYYINLNSKDKKKLNASKERILKCCEIGHYLGAGRVVFHAGYYSDMDKEKAFENIKKMILEIKEEIKRKSWNIEPCVEIMGRKNVFGSIEEVARLVKEIKCGFCIDFAHVLARYGDYKFEEIKERFPQKEWHCHFSGISYNEKGERAHKKTSEEELKLLIENLPKDKDIVLINESPEPVEDSILGLKIYGKK